MLPMNLGLVDKWKDSLKVTFLQAIYTCHLVDFR